MTAAAWFRLRGGLAAAAALAAALVQTVSADAHRQEELLLGADRGAAGVHVSVRGVDFAAATGSSSTVTLRWDRAGGPVLAAGIVPDPARGDFGPVDVTVPAGAEAGYHELLGLQSVGGHPGSQLLARAVFQVAGATAADAGGNTDSARGVSAAAVTAVATPASDGRRGVVAVAVVIAVAATGAAGACLGVRRHRRRGRVPGGGLPS